MDTQHYGPSLAYSDRLHAEKYRAPGETFREAMGRVASVLSDGSDRDYRELRELLMDQRFVPAGRIQASVGSSRDVTPYNCYVSGVIPDSFTTQDNEWGSSIMDRARDAAITMRMGGGIGYDFSTLRPRGALIRKLMSQSSGPIEFMKIFDAVCGATSSSGNRRGAQMAVLRIDHPDILEFVHAKHDQSTLTGFNISVGATDEFMEAVDAGRTFKLRFGGEVYREVDAAELWEAVMRSTWDWGEPGVLFLDTMNRMNNLWYVETLAASNPCGEQPLPPHGACLLGSFNMVKYLTRQPGIGHNGGPRWDLDLDFLASDVPTAVAALDAVIDVARYPLPEQEREAKNKRRMGIGVMGLANALEACGYPYGSPGFLEKEASVLACITRNAYRASACLAQGRGAFKLYDESRYLSGQFVKTLDDDVRGLIAKYGIRNSHLTSIAPTGTIAMTCDNVSSGLEPVYRWAQERRVKMSGGEEQVTIHDYGFRELGVRGRRAAFGEVTPAQHVAVLTAAQNHVDSAVSKTVNTDGSVAWEDFKGLYLAAYQGGAKGCTTFNADGKRAGIFRASPEPSDLPFPVAAEQGILGVVADGASCQIDPTTGRRSCE